MNVRKIQQTRSNYHLLGKLYVKDAIVIAIFSVICLVAGVREQAEVLVAATLLMSLYYSFKNQSMSLAFVVVAGPIIGEVSSGFFQILVYAPFLLSSFYKILSKGKCSTVDIVYCCCLMIVFLSYAIGYEPELIMFLIQIVAMTIFYCIWKTLYNYDVPILVFAFLCSAFVVCGYIFMGGLENNLYAGRLALGDDIKTLSFICAIPLSFYIYSYIAGCKIFANEKGWIARILSLFSVVILIGVLFMTLARGVFLAFGIGTILLLLLSKKKSKSIYFLVITIVILFFVIQYAESLNLFRIERLMDTEQYESGNGRTEIWTHYIDKLFQMGPQYVLFGIGPGNVARISTLEFYAHSTILDYFFSYGLLGITTFLLVEIIVLRKLYKKKGYIPFVIAVTFILAYATHGGAANIEMFILQGLLVVSVI